ncbi:hypothetical protein XU18_4596 [Perkinsela sp. CCAP 1560/4]|nr:hypothetical protein XU18_4596 [Perkinsela sp. CCAP 1560/4]|eukprot:KNH04100.1 hypothetical protein XU18_4596 [Perkinsela sp. CCAP 1560/4]
MRQRTLSFQSLFGGTQSIPYHARKVLGEDKYIWSLLDTTARRTCTNKAIHTSRPQVDQTPLWRRKRVVAAPQAIVNSADLKNYVPFYTNYLKNFIERNAETPAKTIAEVSRSIMLAWEALTPTQRAAYACEIGQPKARAKHRRFLAGFFAFMAHQREVDMRAGRPQKGIQAMSTEWRRLSPEERRHYHTEPAADPPSTHASVKSTYRIRLDISHQEKYQNYAWRQFHKSSPKATETSRRCFEFYIRHKLQRTGFADVNFHKRVSQSVRSYQDRFQPPLNQILFLLRKGLSETFAVNTGSSVVIEDKEAIKEFFITEVYYHHKVWGFQPHSHTSFRNAIEKYEALTQAGVDKVKTLQRRVKRRVKSILKMSKCTNRHPNTSDGDSDVNRLPFENPPKDPTDTPDDGCAPKKHPL